MTVLGWIGAPPALAVLAAAWMTWARWSRRRAAASGSMRDTQRLRIALAGRQPATCDRHEAVITHPRPSPKPPPEW